MVEDGNARLLDLLIQKYERKRWYCEPTNGMHIEARKANMSTAACRQSETSVVSHSPQAVSSFYRAMLCICSTSHGPVSVRLSVCLSVTSRSSTTTAKHRITQTTPHDSPGTLVFLCQRSPRNSTGVTPCRGAKCRWGGSKSATFDK